jgi:flagellar basal-body rod protein FlgB
MIFNIDRALGTHEQALRFRARRAEVLAGNIANSDTPNYKARDLDFGRALAQAQQPAGVLQGTHPRHLGTDAGIGGAELLYRHPSQPSIDGNTVDTQVEYAEFARNAINYQASITFLNGRIKTLMTAIRGE